MHKTLFQTTILGSSGAMPTSSRHNSAQILQHNNKYFLLDCSEGTQMQLRRMKFPIMKINHIFISHLHGDHFLGLPGLLFTFHLLGRKNDLHIYSPKGIKKIIKTQFSLSKMKTSYKVIYHKIKKDKDIIYEDECIKVETIKMLHSIPAFGFLFEEKQRQRKIKKEYVDKYNLPIKTIHKIKNGKDYITPEGKTLSNEELTIKQPYPKSYAFCSDTAYNEKFIKRIREVELLYHEATFMNNFSTLAKEKYHTTTIGAANIAKKANVKNLLIGHYSARYNDENLKDYLNEARSVFPNTYLAEEFKTFKIA